MNKFGLYQSCGNRGCWTGVCVAGGVGRGLGPRVWKGGMVLYRSCDCGSFVYMAGRDICVLCYVDTCAS